MFTDNVHPKPTRDDRLVFRPEAGPPGDVLVTIFLSGGMDAVYTIPPFADPAFNSQRKGFGAAEPGRDGAVALDGFFGLHPDFAELEPLYREKELAIVHAVGLNEPILSHFDATRAIEAGTAGAAAGDGWIGRHLAVRQLSYSPQLRAVALGTQMPEVLRGCEARLLDSLSDFRLHLPANWSPGFLQALKQLHARGSDPMSVAGRGTLQTITALQRLTASAYRPEHKAEYPTDRFGFRMQQVAQLIKAEVGLEAAVLNLGGWDSHIAQADSLARPMQSLAAGLRRFAQDLGERMRRVVVIAISEFGRRIVPNGGGGTDHGRASAMLIVGGGIRGGAVYGRWPGMANDELDEQGNLRVTTDYRHVLAEIVDRRLKNEALDQVFPNFDPEYLNFTADS